MKKLVILFAAATLAFAQDKGGPAPLGPEEIIRVVEVKQASAEAIWRTLNAVFPGVSVNNRMLIIRGQTSVVDTIEEAIKKMDVPPPPSPETRAVPNVEMTIQMLYASAQDDPTAITPAELEATVRQLRGSFTYKSYKVLDTQVLRGRDGQDVDASGTLPGSDSVFQIRYKLRVTPGPAPRSVRMERFQFSMRAKTYTDSAKTQFQYTPVGIITEIDAREGQRTVIGKSNISGTDDAIFLVVFPKVID